MVAMRRYDDPVEVRRGQVSGVDGPEQFLWRGRLWKVRAVVAHWVETGPWWHGGEVQERPSDNEVESGVRRRAAEVMSERELWRVAAGRGHDRADPDGSLGTGGVFDLSFDGADGRWQLVGCED